MIEIGPNLTKALGDIALAAMLITLTICWFKWLVKVNRNKTGVDLLYTMKDPRVYTCDVEYGPSKGGINKRPTTPRPTPPMPYRNEIRKR